jgi:hypothetical protein
MCGAEDLVQPDAMAHRADELGDQVARVLARDGDAEDDRRPARSAPDHAVRPPSSAMARSRSSMP